MAKITQLPDAETLSGSELLPIVQDGETRKSSVAAFFSALESAGGVNYPTVGAGLAETDVGETFAVGEPDGTVSIYLHDAGVGAVFQRRLATTAALALGSGAELLGWQQSGAGAATRNVEDRLRDTVNAKDFGVVGDGVADDSADLNKARTKIDASRQTLHFTYGTFKVPSLGDMLAGEAWEGESPGFNYGVGTTATTIKLSGRPMDTAGHPYVSLKNLTLDGGGTTTYGFVGGFVSQLTSVNITGCTVAGLHLPNGSYPVQTSSYHRSTFNGNHDGFLCENSTPGTQYFTECLFRENTRYGFNGALPASYIGRTIFESNGGSGLFLTGNCGGLMLDTCYFEQNDIANGANGYQARINCTGNGWITFNATQFGSTGITKVAKIDGGRVIFRGSTQVGDTGAVQLLVSETAEVIVENSFYGYCLPANIKIPPRVVAAPNAAIVMSAETDYVDLTPVGASFGNGDFAISVVIECDDSATNLRTILSGAVGCFTLGLAGSVHGTQNIALGKYGDEFFAVVLGDIPIRCPTHIAYVRTGGVGKLYLNARVIWSGADDNNYTGATQYIGTASSIFGKIYAASWKTNSLTSQQVFDIWRCGGSMLAAGIAPTMSLDFDSRNPGKVSVMTGAGNTWCNLMGDAAWTAPNWHGLAPYTVATLPPSAPTGAAVRVTDATAPAWNTAPAGGGDHEVCVTRMSTGWRIR